MGGQSYHNFGAAYDIAIFDSNGNYISNGAAPQYQQAGQIGKSIGLEWGGDWTSIKDYPHFQISNGISESVMNQRFLAGKDIYTGL